LLLIEGNATFHPSLLRKASEWNDEAAALALTSGNKLVGIHVLSLEMIRYVAEHRPLQGDTLEELHASLTAMHSVVCIPVSENLWQRVRAPEDCRPAEQKLDRWLVKPTDGIHARMNCRIFIPISRQIIRFPITPNMVSIFTLGVGFASATFFAYGGYWNTLLGAFLCLSASILDGCDGEVARLKLQESDFGCWAGDDMRLTILSVSFCRHDHRTVEELRSKNVPGVGRSATFWSHRNLPRSWMGAASPRRWTSRAAIARLFNLIKPLQVYRHYVVCAVAELERSLIVERVKAGLRNARTKGKRLGRPRKILGTKRIAARRAQGVGWKRIAAEMEVRIGTIYRVTLEAPKLRKRILEPRQVCELADLFRSD
jgi:hypothetical protein